jgi:uncharacterized protein YbaP (TraB family)
MRQNRRLHAEPRMPASTPDVRVDASEPLARRRAVLALALGLALAPAARTRAATGGHQRFDSGLLWRVSRQGKPDSYIFGTIHLSDARVANPPPAVLAALERSRYYAMEVAVDAMVDATVFDLEQLADDSKLEPLIGTDAYLQTKAILLERGVSERVIEHMKPWAAMLAVATTGAHDASLALDSRLLAAARRAGLRLEALEWVEEQIASFDTIPLASQVALLKHALDNPAALRVENETIIRAWLKEDLAELVRFPERMGSLFPGMTRPYRELLRHLVYDRTVLMHHRLTLPLRGGHVFVAIGAAHLQGEKGLPALVAQDGYRVTRMDLKRM